MEYTLNDLQFIYNLDGLHIHVDKDEDGNLFLKKKLKYDIGKYPTRFACSICGGESTPDELTYFDYDGGFRVCTECLPKYKQDRFNVMHSEDDALMEEWISTRTNFTLEEVGPLDDDEDEWAEEFYSS